MNQKQRVSSNHHGSPRDMKQWTKKRVWYCHQCLNGPFNDRLDSNCPNCGLRRCGLCKEEGLPEEGLPDVEGKHSDISPPQDPEPHHRAALHMTTGHVPHGYPSGAATPFDYTVTENANSNFGLTNLSSVPQPRGPTHIPGTNDSITPSAQYETIPQQTDEFTSEEWHLGSCEGGYVHGYTHEYFHDTNFAGTQLSHDPSRLISDTDIDRILRSTSETAGFNTGGLQSTQSPQQEHVAAGIDVSVTDAGWQSQAFAMPPSPGEMTLDAFPSAYPNFLEDIPTQYPVTWENQHQSGPSFSWIFNNDFPVPFHPQLPPADYQPHQSLPLSPPSSTQSIDAHKLPSRDRVTRKPFKQDECCKPGANQRFACHFYKRNPQLHMACAPKSFANIGHLRQHLDKCHKLGPHHCPTCWAVFDSADQLTNHASTTTARCIPKGGIPVDDLRTFPKIRMTVENKWYWGWRQLFGEAAVRPQCPFFHPYEDVNGWRKDGPSPPRSDSSGRDLIENSRSPDHTNYAEDASLPMPLGWQADALRGMNGGIVELQPKPLGIDIGIAPSMQPSGMDLDR
ncbi:hypothetical protein F4808DRAFT_476206 [Astrocystis sublimbata]|nr:hypothetical protein F4808DRAFT_476206 [Astrocystis sublimbata]